MSKQLLLEMGSLVEFRFHVNSISANFHYRLDLFSGCLTFIGFLILFTLRASEAVAQCIVIAPAAFTISRLSFFVDLVVFIARLHA